LKTKQTIRQFLGAAMLLLFVFGNTPKQWLHDVFANHIDCKKITSTAKNVTQIGYLKFHCHCNDSVIESPFENTIALFCCLQQHQYKMADVSVYSFVIKDCPSSLVLRGPPTALL